jgi:alkylhydroperoxidase family enzyme
MTRTEMLPPDDARRTGAELGIPDFISQNGLFRTLLVHPPIAQSLWGLVHALLREGQLDAGVRELVIMRVAWRTGAAYEWAQHWRVSLSAGLGEEKVADVRDWPQSGRFSGAERAALAAADDLVDFGAARPETWTVCEREFPRDRDCVELLSAIATYHMLAQLLRSLEVPLDDELEMWPPDGQAPRTAPGLA